MTSALSYCIDGTNYQVHISMVKRSELMPLVKKIHMNNSNQLEYIISVKIYLLHRLRWFNTLVWH